uniref:Uncharacterized protein n=1 Tax=Podoviridae sp. ctJDl18 TaxID=2825242 RepID=A0A8S5V0H7_9CAUD|nr:MAG TPA: hypothetical protein [Podoviridae sp. ctJDl18]
MKTITIKIVKKSVMGVVEGLSATIAQHNPEVGFQTVWASDGEEAKLDIYYREAITDLENFLARFSSSTTQQFDLQALADDFSITIKTLVSWPPRLSGVLTNQIQNYLVHAILAGWLSDFPDMNHTDYASMGASDLEAIKEVLLEKDFCFAEAERTADDTVKEGSSAVGAEARGSDAAAKDGNTLDAEARGSDAAVKEGNALDAEARGSDAAVKEGNALGAEARGSDATVKEGNTLDAEARNGDAVDKDEQRGVKGSERNPDFASQHFHQDFVDWSGGRPPFELR